MRGPRIALAVLAAGLALATRAQPPTSPATAEAARPASGPDEVVLKSGAVYHGWVKGQDERRVHLLTSSGTVTELPLSVVAEVKRGTGPAAPEPVPAAASLAAPATATAGERAAAEALPYVQLGIGAGLGSSGMSLLYLPIQFGDDFRLELELGLRKASFDNPSSATPVASAEQRHLGVGLFGFHRLAAWGRAYYGGRISVEKDSSDDQSAAGVALAAGGEWTPNRHVAIGVEAQYRLESWSYPTMTGASASTTFQSLQSVVFVRVFLTR